MIIVIQKSKFTGEKNVCRSDDDEYSYNFFLSRRRRRRKMGEEERGASFFLSSLSLKQCLITFLWPWESRRPFNIPHFHQHR